MKNEQTENVSESNKKKSAAGVNTVIITGSFILFFILLLTLGGSIRVNPSSLQSACEGAPHSVTGAVLDSITELHSEAFALNSRGVEENSIKAIPADPTFRPISSESKEIVASSCSTSPEYAGDRYEFSYIDANGKEVSVIVAKELVDIKILNEGETPTVEAITTVFKNKEQYGKIFKQHNSDENKVEFTKYFVRVEN